jgi:acetyl-CoA carboxylase biotin carboxyl carrier protein
MKKTAEQIQQIAGWMAATDLGLLELCTPHEVIRLGRGGQPLQAPPLPGAGEHGPARPAVTQLRAPSVGIFLHRHPGRAAALVKAGELVRAGEPVGLLQIGVLLLPVTAPADGAVLGWSAPHGSPVGFGTPLIDFQAH